MIYKNISLHVLEYIYAFGGLFIALFIWNEIAKLLPFEPTIKAVIGGFICLSISIIFINIFEKIHK